MIDVFGLVLGFLCIISGVLSLYYSFLNDKKSDRNKNSDSPYDTNLMSKIRGVSLLFFGVILLINFL
jgi:hypothetical protein